MALVTRGETYDLALYKRDKNSSFSAEQVPDLTFKGRPAQNLEKNFYSIRSGVTGGMDEIYIFATHLPAEVSVGDRVFYLGKLWQVSSIGVYLEATRVVNASIMDSKKLMEKAPKGLTLR